MQQINAECGCCGKGILVKGDGARPTARANNEDRLVFCDQQCAERWLHEPHCGWCGATAQTGALLVEARDGPVRHFCSPEHQQHYQSAHPQPLRVVR